ncbi:MAG TPA: outer membrane protein assembly factor BamA [Deltaproteobacteria bacterium]|nr:outer membrane protein assembly factor BamA [Deltaproteobacteria bacterium]
MNLTLSRHLFIILLFFLTPLYLNATVVNIATADATLSKILQEVLCVSLRTDAALSIAMETSDGVFRVYDTTDLTYTASTPEEALDGYLRLKGICVVDQVNITGQSRISSEAIRFRITTTRGDIVHRDRIRKDIESIFAMGYFETCDASFSEGTLTFVVTEYPVIVSIDVEGNDKIKDEDILSAIGLKRFDILNTRLLKTSIDRIRSLYREKGFYNVMVGSDTQPTEGGITLTFSIEENEKLYVRKVEFDGNENISSRKLRDIMETKNRWILGLFGHAGSYLEAGLDNDLLRIEQFYADNGYIQAKVGRPRVDVQEDTGIFITIPIEEGPLFTIGSIDITGDLIQPREELMKKLDLKTGDVMSKSKVHTSIENLRDVYMNQGYAYAQIRPITKEEEETTVGLIFKITKGNPVSIDTIYIRGNQKTRDKVIRRELQLDEGDLFSSTDLRRSRDRISRLGYFSTVTIDPIPREEETMSLLVDVEETTTGAFAFGIAYSSLDGAMGTLELSENNLLGLGLKSRLSTEYGAKKKNYMVDFEEPWLFGRPVSLGVRLFNMEREYVYYTKESRGGNIRLGYPLIEEIRHYIIYSYTHVLELKDIDPVYLSALSEDEITGGVTSSITNTLHRDTTNDFFRPTRGSDLMLSLEYAGLGGDFHFTRVTATAAQFFPLYKDTLALMLKARWGTINPAQGDDLPEYERFTLGGMNSIRGFKYGEIGPRDTFGSVIGGKRMLVFNTELSFPIANIPGLYGILFFDQGNSYEKMIDLTNLKRSYGAGIRWVTPMGPLRLEYGKVIDPKDFESKSQWDFTIGRFF